MADMRNIIKAALFTPMGHTVAGERWGLNLLFTAQPGTGKSSIIRASVEAAGLSYEMLSPGMRGEGAFGVVPVPEKVGDATMLTYPPPEWVARLGKRGVVFLDEINTAPPALQPPLLGLVLDGVIGASTLPPGVRRMAAMNATEDAAGGWDLPPALANRFGHLPWEAPSVEHWTDWLLGGDEDAPNKSIVAAEKEEARVLANWTLPWSRARGTVAGFIRRRPELLHKQPGLGDPNLSKAWPSRRSWEFATRAMASAELHGLSDVDSEEFISAFIGVAAAAELSQYVREADLPDPEELLDGKVKWEHNPRRLDLTMAVLGACASLVQNKDAPKRKERAGALWTIMAPIVKDAADVVVPAGRVLCKAHLSGLPEARPVLARIQPILKAAGITAADS